MIFWVAGRVFHYSCVTHGLFRTAAKELPLVALSRLLHIPVSFRRLPFHPLPQCENTPFIQADRVTTNGVRLFLLYHLQGECNQK